MSFHALGRLVRWLVIVIVIALIAFFGGIAAWNKAIIPAWEYAADPTWEWIREPHHVNKDVHVVSPTPIPTAQPTQAPKPTVEKAEDDTPSVDDITVGSADSIDGASTDVGVAHTYQWATGDILGDGSCYMQVSGPDDSLDLPTNHGAVAQSDFVAGSPAVFEIGRASCRERV